MLGLLVPPPVRRGTVSLQARRDHRLSFYGLLVEISPVAAAPIEAITADRPKMTVLRGLDFHEPAQRLQAAIKHLSLPAGASTQQESVCQFCVVVGQFLLKPRPVRFRRPV